MTVEELNKKHPHWVRMADFWQRIELLKCGGWDMIQNAALFLKARPMEPQSVYAARLADASYQNIFGTALGWYAARFFHDEPQFHFRDAAGKSIEPEPGVTEFIEDADGAGCSLVNLARTKWFADTVAYGCTYVVTDLPMIDGNPVTLRDQEEMGALDPYLTTFDPRQVIDWDVDTQGNFTRLVIATCADGGKTDRWFVYDQKTVSVYEAPRQTGKDANDKREAKLIRFGTHALASVGRVPVRKLDVPDELWFGWRVYPQVVAHFNAENAYQWLLLMACIVIPVITGEYTGNPKGSETQWIQLETGGTFGYTEPGGIAFEHAAKRVEQLKEDVYRMMYLQAQARSAHATAAAQSGLSKQMDMEPSNEVLDGFGGVWREHFEAIVEDVLLIRGLADIDVDVQGLTFEADELAEAQSAMAVLDLGIPSETFRRAVFKRVARCYLDADPDTQEAIDNEIDSAPTEAQSQQAALLQQAAALSEAKNLAK